MYRINAAVFAGDQLEQLEAADTTLPIARRASQVGTLRGFTTGAECM